MGSWRRVVREGFRFADGGGTHLAAVLMVAVTFPDILCALLVTLQILSCVETESP